LHQSSANPGPSLQEPLPVAVLVQMDSAWVSTFVLIDVVPQLGYRPEQDAKLSHR
jgi:hypothetical protein